MGTSQSTTSTSIQIPVEESLLPDNTLFSLSDSINTDTVLKRYGFSKDCQLIPGSGRMTKTFLLRKNKSTSNTTTTDSTTNTNSNTNVNNTNTVECTAVCKALWILEQHTTTTDTSSSNVGYRQSSYIEEQMYELERIRKLVINESCVVPFIAWFLGSETKIAPKNILQHFNLNTTISATIRPIYLLRPTIYITLADRIVTRPWLTISEKLYITSQILLAINTLHEKNIIHGNITTENITLTSLNYVIITDIATYKTHPITLLENDISEYLYYYSPQPPKTDKRCYIAPERFVTTKNNNNMNINNNNNNNMNDSSSIPTKLTREMDIFAIGCVITELFLNGSERCFELGELMEYKNNGNTNILQQKLNKIELSSIRAACKHMLQINPKLRLSTTIEYYNRLIETEQFPKSFTILTQLAKDMTLSIVPDTRIMLAIKQYNNILYETIGIYDIIGTEFFNKILGTVMSSSIDNNNNNNNNEDQEQQQSKNDNNNSNESNNDGEETEEKKYEFDSFSISNEQLFAEVESLLKDLNAFQTSSSNKDVINNNNEKQPSIIPEEKIAAAIPPTGKEESSANNNITPVEQRTELCKSSLLIYLQLILSTIRHCQRPQSKLIGLQLIIRLAKYSSDEARLQRIVPVTISLLQDQDPLVRAFTIQVLTSTLYIINSFPPSDSKIFTQYIFKRIAHMITDPALIVRLAFSKCIAKLAETAQRFLDISHAVRLYEAVGNNGGSNLSGTTSRDESGIRNNNNDTTTTDNNKDPTVFGDDVAKLLDSNSRVSSKVSIATTTDQTEGTETASAKSDFAVNNTSAAAVGKTLITSNYNAELSVLYETISRWVIHITTDQSEHSSLPKRAILNDLGRLCSFFGSEGVTSFILPQILAFLNEKKDWELRAFLFDHLPSVCQCIGRAATEEFVLPCVEIGLVDIEERVVRSALCCLSRIVEMGLLSRSIIIGSNNSVSIKSTSPALLQNYGSLLLHPSCDVRLHTIEVFATICGKIGRPDCDVYLIPQLLPFLRFRPTAQHVCNVDTFAKCLKNPLTRDEWNSMLEKVLASDKSSLWSSGAWTSIGVTVNEDKTRSNLPDQQSGVPGSTEMKEDPVQLRLEKYLKMLVKHNAQSSTLEQLASGKTSSPLQNGIEGSVKLAQSIMFPRQNRRTKIASLPQWYAELRDAAEKENTSVTEASSIRSVSALGHVYGLSIMGPAEGAVENVVGISDDSGRGETASVEGLRAPESRITEAAFAGEWGSETALDPSMVDTSLLVTKMKALQVPPLPERLGDAFFTGHGGIEQKTGPDRAARVKGLVATSSVLSGHKAPIMRLAVSVDQRFFVSASHDGTCRVWEVPHVDDSGGLLESSLTYREHSMEHRCRINDAAIIEGTHSVVSGDSTGTVRVWRVDVVTAAGSMMQTEISRTQDRARVAGCSNLRMVDPMEGEILAVSHFNSPSSSIILYGTQKGTVHSWDLRSCCEPFSLTISPELGHLSTMALGNDRNWVVTGTSSGYLALWDIRFQRCLKLWRHSRRTFISRLATSFCPPPQSWGNPALSGSARPFIFVASGSNECAMFDAMTGQCRECFRSVLGENGNLNSPTDEPPSLNEIAMNVKSSQNLVRPRSVQMDEVSSISVDPINCMVGSIGPSNHSYLVSGGSDTRIRFWDFSAPSKCYVLSGRSQNRMRQSFERIDFEGQRRLMLCRESQTYGQMRVPHGLRPTEQYHTDSIQDIKVVDSGTLVSCSRDCTVKIWR